MKFEKLEKLARELGYSLYRNKKEINWTSNDKKHSGTSFSVAEAYEDLKLDYQLRMKNEGLCAAS
jgi:hypothetical protein